MKDVIENILSLSAAVFAGTYLITSGIIYMWKSFKELVKEEDDELLNKLEGSGLTRKKPEKTDTERGRVFNRLRDVTID